MGDSDVIARAKEKQRERLALYEMTRLKTDISVAVPTVDSEVKAQLRIYGEPVCLFGEDVFDRRERLKVLIATQPRPKKMEEEKEVKREAVQTETFFTIGSTDLLSARRIIANDSRARSSARLAIERSSDPGPSSSTEYWDSPDVVSTSQVGDSRPLTAIALCPFTTAVAVAGWSGDINVFSTLGSNEPMLSLKGHQDRCCSIAWTSEANASVHLVSGGSDHSVRLWSLSDNGREVGSLEGHEMRVNRVAVHPHLNRFVASTSDDETWRLWDIEKRTEVLLQEGHVSEVFGLCFHPDGSLVGTSDTAGVIRVWDLRTGRSILGFDREHVEQVIGLDFSLNGYLLASCSADNSVRVFDLRKKMRIETLTAHTKLVSSVKFGGQRGDTLMTAGYDCVARIWRTSDFKIVKNLPLHETRIMSADMSRDGRTVATACYDRTFKLWANSSQSLKMEIA